ncbi:unnamed protein product [Ectocarpus fasciculatus]
MLRRMLQGKKSYLAAQLPKQEAGRRGDEVHQRVRGEIHQTHE